VVSREVKDEFIEREGGSECFFRLAMELFYLKKKKKGKGGAADLKRGVGATRILKY